MVFPLMNGFCWRTSGRRSLGRTTEQRWDGGRPSMLVSLFTWTQREHKELVQLNQSKESGRGEKEQSAESVVPSL